MAGRTAEHVLRLVPDAHHVLSLEVRLGQRQPGVQVVGVALDGGLKPLLVGTGRLGGGRGWKLPGQGAAGLPGLSRLGDQEHQGGEGHHAARAPQEAAKGGPASGGGRSRGDRRLGGGELRRGGRPGCRLLVELLQDPGGVQLQGVAFPGELLGAALGRGGLQLGELAQQHVALSQEIPVLERVRCRLRGRGAPGSHPPDEQDAEDEADDQGPDRGGPVDALRAHHSLSAGGVPPGQP